MLDIHPERSTIEELAIMRDDDPQSTKRGLGLILSILAFIVAGAAVSRCEAAEIYRSFDQHERPMALKLLDAPCKESVLKWIELRVRPEYREGFKAAILHWGGQDWDACWLDVDGAVYSIDSEGVMLNGGTGLPRRLFRDPSV